MMPRYRYRIELNENYKPPVYVVKRKQITGGWDFLKGYNPHKFWHLIQVCKTLEEARDMVDKQMHPEKIIRSTILESFEPES